MSSDPSLPITPLVGVCLCDESSCSPDKVIGTVYLSAESRSQVLTEFRKSLKSTSLSKTLGERQYVFLTPRGWEVNGDLENVVKLCNIITGEGLVNIRIAYDRPRLGVAIEGPPDVPMGFIFCDPTATVAELKHEISSQLPSLYGSLSSKQFCFLDRNSWPLSQDQEDLLSVLEISSSNSVKIRCNRMPFSRNVSVIDEGHDRSRLSVTSNPIPLAIDGEITRGTLSPINEGIEQWKLVSDYTNSEVPVSHNVESFEVLLSYVHTEAGKYALLLKDTLEDLGFSVFLDIHCIEGGKDWQDVLNSAITNCSLFVPLITMRYGQTLWTNREIKLADVLGKMILPVNFNKSWPPKCLAIQFATTQYIPGNPPASDSDITLENFTEIDAADISSKIAEQYQRELAAKTVVADSEALEISLPTLISKQRTEIFDDPASTPSSAGLKLPLLGNYPRRHSAIKSYASSLPESIPKQYRMSVLESREGKSLIVISCSKKQKEFAEGLVIKLKKIDCEVWCSCDVDDEEKSAVFQEKVNEAGAVIFVLSKDFAEDTFCEQQVYYCEQRKRIIPLIYEPIEMPNWMATLIGTSTFISCKSQSYLTALLDRVKTVLNPQKASDELKQMIRQKTEIAKLSSELDQRLPKGDYVYISGGTQFYSKIGEAVSKEIGKQLARVDDIVLVTGGFYGVGETVGRSFFEERMRLKRPHGICHVVAVRDENDKSSQTRQNPDHTFQALPYGETLFFGSSVRQREMLTPRVVDLCVLIEGGPGAAFEAQQFVWNGNQVVPIRATGGAAGGSFNIPSITLTRPPNVTESDWAVLGDKDASPSDIASAVVRIVTTLKNPDIAVPGRRSRSGTASGKLGEVSLAQVRRSKVLMRSDTDPVQDNTVETLKGVKRALSEKRAKK